MTRKMEFPFCSLLKRSPSVVVSIKKMQKLRIESGVSIEWRQTSLLYKNRLHNFVNTCTPLLNIIVSIVQRFSTVCADLQLEGCIVSISQSSPPLGLSIWVGEI